jgi:O-acetyl-ADP-ribose deacetylase (regulator of RNase III)
LPDTGGCFTSARLANFNDKRWPGVAQSTTEQMSYIENINNSKIIKQETFDYTDEDVNYHTAKNTARDRPKTVNMQNVNVPACLNISYEYDNDTLVCDFDTEAGNVQVKVYSGDIINMQKIQAVVCSENKAGNAKGFLAKLLLKNGGEEYLQDKATKFRYIPAFGDIVTTTGGRNSYLWIIHAIMPRRDPHAICPMYRKIFEEVAERRLTSVSLPLLGTGNATYKYCSISKLLLLLCFLI